MYLSFLMTKVYENTGFFEKQNDDQLEIYKRVEVIRHACELGFEDCVRNSVSQFQSWRLTPQPDINNPYVDTQNIIFCFDNPAINNRVLFHRISPNLKGTVYCTAIRIGGQKEWDFAWQRYLKSNVGSEKDILLSALGCSREPWILSRWV